MKKTILQISVLLCMLTLLWSCKAKNSADAADSVFTNAKVYTQNDSLPWAEAVAIKGKEIVFVGSAEDAKAYIGDRTEVTDLGGKMLMPGFVESHIHPTVAWLTVGADLQTDNMEELKQRLITWAKENPDSKVVRGFGWRYNMFPLDGPNKKLLDSIFPDRPVFLIAIDGHGAWVNSKALEMAGITKSSPDPQPPFSTYKKDPKTGELTGYLVEVTALQVVLNKLIPLDLSVVKQAMLDYMPKFSEAGITTVFDTGVQGIPQHEGFNLYQELEKEDKLNIRVIGSYYYNRHEENPFPILEDLRTKYNSELVKASLLKLNLDGGDIQYTAAMLHPYVGKNGFKGNLLMPSKRLLEVVSEAHDKGISTLAHIYGDRALREYMDAVEYARKKNPNSKSRHTASHLIYIDDAELPRFQKLNISAQFSAQWATPDVSILGLATEVMGEKLINSNYMRIGSVARAKGRLAFGTDWPASGNYSTYRPLDAIHVATTRSMIVGKGVKEQLPRASDVVSLEQAIRANTLGSAYVINMEDKIGSIEKGKLADFIVLEKNLFDLSLKEIRNTKILLTMMNGKITHKKGI